MLATARRGAESLENVGRVDSAATKRIAVLSPKGAGGAGRSQNDVVFVPLSMAKSRLFGTANIGTRDSLDLISVKVTDSAELRLCCAADIDSGVTRRTTFRSKIPPDILHARAGANREWMSIDLRSRIWPRPERSMRRALMHSRRLARRGWGRSWRRRSRCFKQTKGRRSTNCRKRWDGCRIRPAPS